MTLSRKCNFALWVIGDLAAICNFVGWHWTLLKIKRISGWTEINFPSKKSSIFFEKESISFGYSSERVKGVVLLKLKGDWMQTNVARLLLWTMHWHCGCSHNYDDTIWFIKNATTTIRWLNKINCYLHYTTCSPHV